jgi:hypothetical protein
VVRPERNLRAWLLSLFYDSDGEGPAAAVTIATITPTNADLTINASHFLII